MMKKCHISNRCIMENVLIKKVGDEGFSMSKILILIILNNNRETVGYID